MLYFYLYFILHIFIRIMGLKNIYKMNDKSKYSVLCDVIL